MIVEITDEEASIIKQALYDARTNYENRAAKYLGRPDITGPNYYKEIYLPTKQKFDIVRQKFMKR
jgi:hypothetical protein